mmetsp:Transcript_21740/g.61063  ORF Transcript_21740/g.61063 Transcript_21740/m.61063 type:complete len:228 (-) Transcript_21740:54-737(-)
MLPTLRPAACAKLRHLHQQVLKDPWVIRDLRVGRSEGEPGRALGEPADDPAPQQPKPELLARHQALDAVRRVQVLREPPGRVLVQVREPEAPGEAEDVPVALQRRRPVVPCGAGPRPVHVLEHYLHRVGGGDILHQELLRLRRQLGAAGSPRVAPGGRLLRGLCRHQYPVQGVAPVPGGGGLVAGGPEQKLPEGDARCRQDRLVRQEAFTEHAECNVAALLVLVEAP